MIKKLGKRPFRLLAYGTPSVGKTTLAASAPAPVFICCEDGAREVNADAWTFQGDRVTPASLDEFRSALKSITDQHEGYQTLVVDGLDALDKLAMKHLCDKNPKWGGNFQHEGYGKPESMLLSTWREVVVDLERANNAGLNIILLGHSRVEKFAAPDMPQIDRYQISVTSHKLGDVAGFLSGWSDVVGFCKFEPMLVEEGKRTRGVGVQGARIMYLQRTDSFDAKCRYKNAPAVIPMSWTELERVMKASELTVDSVKGQLLDLAPRLPEAKRTAMVGWLESPGLTLDQLVQGLDAAKGYLLISENGKV